jgi:hypothetical protein
VLPFVPAKPMSGVQPIAEAISAHAEAGSPRIAAQMEVNR